MSESKMSDDKGNSEPSVESAERAEIAERCSRENAATIS
jgi:hypothetical protein